ncbi:helix-turn-helix domain-containing protein [Patescibacteria group bacterium]|nr:helix-turn-helix domain-containing protein [Patescibacteria group bacterium]
MSTKYASFIKALRTQKSISQSVMAEKLGLSRASYIAVEQGRRELTLGEFEKISGILGVTLEDIDRGEVPNYEKYKQMILTFLRLNKNVTKTKLAKLLYFADFGWYYTHLESMSGMQYRKIQYGPVADSYFRLIDEMSDSGDIAIEQTKDGAMLISETRGGAKADLSRITSEEKKLMAKISKKWKGKKTADIVSFTHRQLPYMFAEDNDLVSYEIFGQENPDDIY